mmetsp:Transcript_60090/g.95413  ORF Transcript_60090/g.95413 Transcript_60090/m.95413 type:complete len:123 (-) Transcript_60090:16-384(-)
MAGLLFATSRDVAKLALQEQPLGHLQLGGARRLDIPRRTSGSILLGCVWRQISAPTPSCQSADKELCNGGHPSSEMTLSRRHLLWIVNLPRLHKTTSASLHTTSLLKPIAETVLQEIGPLLQ